MAKKTSKTPVSREKSIKKLTAAEQEAYKKKLLALRARISGDVSAMTDGALNQSLLESSGGLSVAPSHMADIGSDNFEREQTLSFIQSDNAILVHIEEALARIKAGTYGICENCGCSIPKVRLDVLPYTASCVGCVEIAQQKR